MQKQQERQEKAEEAEEAEEAGEAEAAQHIASCYSLVYFAAAVFSVLGENKLTENKTFQ